MKEISIFNKNSRTKNVIRSSAAGTVCNILNLLMGFLYRSVFIHFLSSAYLGINGLFTNILQILSFAELGIGTAVSFRLYHPIILGDTEKVGQLMNFYRRVYFAVAGIVVAAGLSVYPFLNYFIKDTAEIPAELNIHAIYLLYLFNTAATYVCVTPQTLLDADQKQYKLSIFQAVSKLLKYLVQTFVLIILRDYTFTLVFGIFTTLLLNIGISVYVKRQYPDVFRIESSIPLNERREIFLDTRATLCHKVGATVLGSTDSIILSGFLGIVTTGLYSNYSLIVSSVNSLLTQLFGSFIASLGNTHFSVNSEDSYIIYKRLLFANFWVAGMCTVCLVGLISDFIAVWLGEQMVLDHSVILTICLQFYLESVRHISMSYITGSGLFNRDILRPFVEAAINIVVSVAMVIKIGMAGVFLGTIVSHLMTVTWREPLLLYRYEFKKPVREYWQIFGTFCIPTALIAFTFCRLKICAGFVCSNIGLWLAEALVCLLMYNAVMVFLFFGNDNFRFYVRFIKKSISKIKIFRGLSGN